MADKRDANEAAIIELWRAAGCVVIQMDRRVGFDTIVACPRTGIHICEIKNEARRWRLTPSEYARCAELEAIGVTYSIVKNEQEAAELIGLSVDDHSAGKR